MVPPTPILTHISYPNGPAAIPLSIRFAIRAALSCLSPGQVRAVLDQAQAELDYCEALRDAGATYLSPHHVSALDMVVQGR